MHKNSYKKTKIGEHNLSLETQMMSFGYDPFMSEGAVKPPVFLTSTFAFKSAEDGAEFFEVATGKKPAPQSSVGGLIYSRINHPNLEIIEDRIALLESGDSCAVFSSGMASISTTFLALLKPDDVVVHSSPLYGGTEGLIRNVLKDLNIKSVAFTDGLNPSAISQALEEARHIGKVGAIFIETPGNPTNALVDFSLVKKIVDDFNQKHNCTIPIICDNTLLGPVFQKPLLHGVDLVCYSLTKYIGGHSDLVAGAVVGKKSLMEKIRAYRIALGSHLDPHSSWMIGRSLETLYLRMNRASESAEKIADWMHQNYPQLKIYHPKYLLNEHYQETFKKQCLGYGSTFAFTVEGGRATAFKFINNLRIFKSAVSLGGTESLVCHPASTTHSGLSEELRTEFEISEDLIRLSIGIENPADLIADLKIAFQQIF